jgi:L-rhamnonate dehydratase
MKIENIKASVHKFNITLPLLDKPLKDRKIVFCEVETDEGILGWGMAGHFFHLR